MIPPTVHRIAIGTIPETYETYWQAWQQLHPGWTFKTWTPPFNPDDWELGQYFEEASCPSQMSDFLRWEIIWREGGIYTDWDVEPHRPFDSWLEQDFFIGTEDGSTFSPGLFGAEPEHHAVRKVVERYHAHEWDRLPATTGPQLVSRVLRDLTLTVVPQRLFYPYHYNETADIASKYPDAYSTHHWGHSWKGIQ